MAKKKTSNIGTLSVIILSKNESERITSCIRQVSWADEILVIDNGSTDDTTLRAKIAGATVIHSRYTDFSALRTLGKDIAKSDWVLYIDADETVNELLVKEIQYVINTFNSKSSPRAYSIPRKNFYLGFPWPKIEKLQRLFYKSSLIDWYGELHETAWVEGLQSDLHSPLYHNTHRTLEEMVEKTNVWSNVEAKLRIQAHHPKMSWWRFIRVMLTGFFNSYIGDEGWKVGTLGIIEAIFQSYSMFITYAKLWELQSKRT